MCGKTGETLEGGGGDGVVDWFVGQAADRRAKHVRMWRRVFLLFHDFEFDLF